MSISTKLTRADADTFADFRAALTQYGLNDQEIAVFQACVSDVPRPVAKIARTANLNRTRAYDILSLLTERGLVSEVMRENVKHFRAAPLSMIVRNLEQREVELRNERRKLELKLASGGDLMRSVTGGPTIRAYSGNNGISRAIQEALQRGEGRLYGFISANSDNAAATVETISRAMRTRADSYDESPECSLIAAFEDSYALRECATTPGLAIRTLPSLPFTLDLLVVPEAVFVLKANGQVKAAVIEDSEFAATLIGLHQFMWEVTKISMPQIFAEPIDLREVRYGS